MSNNNVVLSGKIVSEFEFSHEVYGEGFYTSTIQCPRNSGTTDDIKIVVSERVAKVTDSWCGKNVKVSGEFRSYNKHEESRNRLLLFVFVQHIEETESEVYENTIELEGYICKEPTYRATPLGREIADVFLAVNRPYGKSDYIPCIFWGRNARYIGEQSVGNKINVVGRIQSRIYNKHISETESVEMVAYEVSTAKFSILEGNK